MLKSSRRQTAGDRNCKVRTGTCARYFTQSHTQTYYIQTINLVRSFFRTLVSALSGPATTPCMHLSLPYGHCACSQGCPASQSDLEFRQKGRAPLFIISLTLRTYQIIVRVVHWVYFEYFRDCELNRKEEIDS
ncbi:hypothetical protein TWF696_009075 [Orbilia brochopaga]|uniref:Uncharacterized protein n=1 Tax=Orbilia brochopaga TaxID=3140254 RepID=A0AAV9UI69_9PEZI